MNRSLLQRNTEVSHPKNPRDKVGSKMMKRFHMHRSQCIDLFGARMLTSMRMFVRRRTSWMISVIAISILFANASSSASVKLRKPRRRLTTEIPYHLGPVIVKVIHKYPDDEFTSDVSPNCTENTCRNAHDYSDISKSQFGQNGLLPDERYIVYPKKYEHFVSKKNTGRINRYKRYTGSQKALSDVNHSTIDNANKTLKNENKSKLKKVALHKTHKHIKMKDSLKSLSEVTKTKRSLADDYTSRRNATYYAQRRAVMERYYARQREINARYANRTNIPRLSHDDTSRNYFETNNSILFKLGYQNNNDKDTTVRNSGTFNRSSITIDPIYSNESENNRTPIRLNNRQDVSEIGLKFTSQTWNNSNVQRNILDYTTPVPCTNVSLSGTFAPKTRPKHVKNCNNETKRDDETLNHTSTIRSTSNETAGDDYKIWGRCQGKIVYQHNLNLGLKGPSNLDTVFEVIIQDSICITCVEALQYNQTRARVTLDSGGRGYEYIKLRLKGYKNEGFSYMIIVWGVKKVDSDCKNID